MVKLAVIMLNYNTWEDTIKEIEHIHNMFKIDYSDFIIVDNNSPNISYEKLCGFKEKKGIVLIKSDTNGGYARGNNIGMKFAYKQGYKFALIVNNDIEFTNNETISELVKCLEIDHSIVAISPDICSQDGKIYNRNSKRPSFFDMTFCMIAYIKKGRKIEKINNNYAYVYRPQGCCMIVRLEHMNDVDYFDENTFLYNEENILAERILDRDLKVACCTNKQVIHNHSKTVKSNVHFSNIINYNQESFKYYLEKYRLFNTLEIKICIFFNYLKLKIIY